MQVTTDVHESCTAEFLGTSASASMAAGIYALVLQAKYVALYLMREKLSVCRVSICFPLVAFHWYVTCGVRSELISLWRVVYLFKLLTVKRFPFPCHFPLGKTTRSLDFISCCISSFNAEFSFYV